MKTLKIHGAENIAIEQADVPEPADDEVRVRMQYGGICGSDLHYYFHGRNGAFVVNEPFTPGHEMSGVVDLDPSGRWAAGTRVTIAQPRTARPSPASKTASTCGRVAPTSAARPRHRTPRAASANTAWSKTS
jgi:L-idonate 5-dehydrogenase